MSPLAQLFALCENSRIRSDDKACAGKQVGYIWQYQSGNITATVELRSHCGGEGMSGKAACSAG